MSYGTIAQNAPTSQEYEALERARMANAQAEADAIARGYRVFGYVPSVRGDEWQQRLYEQTDGLPPAYVERARQVLTNEQRARTTLSRIRAEAQAWVDQHRPSDGLPGDGLKDAWTKARAALEDAVKATGPVMRALGVVVQDVETARAEINQLPLEEDVEKQRHQAAMARFATRRATAQTTLSRYGQS